MNPHARDVTVVVLAALLGGFAAGVVACASAAPTPFVTGDGGSGYDATVVDASRPDAPGPAPGTDGGDSAASLAADAGLLLGKCEPVQGPACDLVLQQCPAVSGAPQQCAIDPLADGGYTTTCIAVSATQHLQEGHGCCPNGDPAQNPCAFPLECLGDPTLPCNSDGGVLPGRCTPHCCGDGGDDSVCGTSVPEGYPGHCDVLVVDSNGTPLYNACTYALGCQPFQIKPCPADQVCEIIDPTGTAACSAIYSVDGGPLPGENQPCVALNNCADGLVCLQSGSNSLCVMMCLTPGSVPPFDAGVLDGGPLTGGCPAGESCNITVGGFPAWISFCGP